MRQPQITIPLDIPDVNVLKVEWQGEAYHITLESTLTYAYCQKCGQQITAFHEHDPWVTVQHLPILGRAVFLHYQPKRYRCPDCAGHPTTTQQLSWHRPNSPHTTSYDAHVLRALINSTIQDVSEKEHLPYTTVEGVLERTLAHQVDWTRFTDLETLGIDEIALKKGHRDFVVIISARCHDGQVSVVGVLPDRRQTTVAAFLRRIPAPLRVTIRSVCGDLYEGYIQAIRASLPHARLVLDRFHVAKLYREAADSVRKSEMKRLKRTLAADVYHTLKGALWAFRQRRSALNPEERAVLDRLFALSPLLQDVYNLREALTNIFDTAPAKNAAKRQLRHWIALVKASKLTCFDTFVATLLRYWNAITNYFIDFRTSGFVEGLNNKLKVLKRRCYGIFNLTHFFQRIFLDVEGYRSLA